MTQVFKIEILVIDHDGNGPTEIAAVLENTRYPNRCISPKVMSIESRDVNWSDEHPLNKKTTLVETYKKLFEDEFDSEEATHGNQR